MAGTAFPVRYRLVGLLTTGSMINYLDRVNIAVAAPVMMESLGWDEGRFGVIFSAFLVGFTEIFGPMTAGFLVAATGNWALPFLVAAGLAAVSFMIFFFLVVPEPIRIAESDPGSSTTSVT